jgi:WD40 repeat protein
LITLLGDYHQPPPSQRTPPNHTQDIALRNGTPPYEFPSSLSPNSVPASLRKEGTDWFLMYNPRLPQKTLDVSLLHQFNHESVVCCVRFSKDGRYLATGCNRTAQIFDMKTGQMVCQLSDDTAVMEGDLYIRSVCFSPDGKYLATGAEDRQIRVCHLPFFISEVLTDGNRYGTLPRGAFSATLLATSKRSTLSTFRTTDTSLSLVVVTRPLVSGIWRRATPLFSQSMTMRTQMVM